MSDNPQPGTAHPPGRFFALPGHRVVTLEGRDAQAFAQAQFMNDVATLGDGQWQWNGWLTPKGRVIALFALWKVDAERLGLLLPDADADDFIAALRRYLFRSKATISHAAGHRAFGSFSAPATAAGNAFALDANGIELDLGSDGGPRTLRIATSAQAPEDADAADRWTAFDLEHGLPRLPPGQAEQWTPQQLSLQRLRAYSVKKGCYPGQEIVARTHFLGQAKRELVLFAADSPLPAGSEVRDDAHALGTLVSSAGVLALGVLPLERPQRGLHADGVALREQRLRGGLAR